MKSLTSSLVSLLVFQVANFNFIFIAYFGHNSYQARYIMARFVHEFFESPLEFLYDFFYELAWA